MKQNPDINDQRLKALFGEALGTMPIPKETEQVYDEFMTSRRASSYRRKNLYIGIASAAAILVLTLILWSTMRTSSTTDYIQVFTSLKPPKEITFSKTDKRMEVSTPARTTTFFTLSDGTEVLLSANSLLEYDNEFTSNKREVKLVGEARFSVAKDSLRPFIVHTDQIQMQVLGTVFDVKAYPQVKPDVTLYEGCVEVSHNGVSTFQMQPGEQAFLDKQGNLQLSKASDEQAKWAEGKFAFDNKDLKSVMQEIGCWYNISVVFHSRPLLEERIYFQMDRTKSVENVLEVLNDMGIAKFECVGEKIVVANK